MELFPAIDLKDGLAVRLTKGLMDSAKIYSNEPWELAKRFEDYGSSWLHVVDLNGAFKGEPKNLEQIEKIRKNCNLKIQLGGGIRDEDTIKKYVDLGIDRVILGSIAQKNPNFVIEMAKKYNIAIGIDAKDGYVAVEGWIDVSEIKATELAKIYQDSDIDAIIATDISKDGTLSGINLEFTEDIATASSKKVIASGGVKDLDDLIKLKNSGKIYGAIIGKAYYENRLDLKEAFKVIQK